MEHAIVLYSWAMVDGVITKVNKIIIPEQCFVKVKIRY